MQMCFLEILWQNQTGSSYSKIWNDWLTIHLTKPEQHNLNYCLGRLRGLYLSCVCSSWTRTSVFSQEKLLWKSLSRLLCFSVRTCEWRNPVWLVKTDSSSIRPWEWISSKSQLDFSYTTVTPKKIGSVNNLIVLLCCWCWWEIISGFWQMFVFGSLVVCQMRIDSTRLFWSSHSIVGVFLQSCAQAAALFHWGILCNILVYES